MVMAMLMGVRVRPVVRMGVIVPPRVRVRSALFMGVRVRPVVRMGVICLLYTSPSPRDCS